MSARNELELLARRGGGMGDIPLESILPGSLRRPPTSLVEGGGGPMALASNEAMLRAILGGMPVAEVPFGAWQVNSYLLGTTNAILVDEPFRRNRRAVVITNTHTVNDVWIGPDSTTRVNLGEKIPPLGSKSYPMREIVRIYAISNAAGTVVSISQFAT